MEDEDDTDKPIDEKWESIKTIIKETKQQLIEKNGSMETLRNKWYDEECKIAIVEMKKAREKWLITGRREWRTGVPPQKKRSTQSNYE